MEYVAVLIATYHLASLGTTGHQHLHGQAACGRRVHIWGKVNFYIPKKRRSKLGLALATGVYLGTLMGINGCYIGMDSGVVTRARGVARVREDERWDPHSDEATSGTPGRPRQGPDDSIIEGYVSWSTPSSWRRHATHTATTTATIMLNNFRHDLHTGKNSPASGSRARR